MDNTLLAFTFADLRPWAMLAAKLGLCLAVYLLVAWPSGRAIMEHTGERAVRNVWHAAIGFLALVVFVGMSGVGEVYEAGFNRVAQEEHDSRVSDESPDDDREADAPASTNASQESDDLQGS